MKTQGYNELYEMTALAQLCKFLEGFFKVRWNYEKERSNDGTDICIYIYIDLTRDGNWRKLFISKEYGVQ